MKNAKITLTALILVFGISLGCKDTEAAKEQYRHEHAFDGVHEEEKDIYSAATDCNSAAMDVVNAENKESKIRDEMREADPRNRAALAVDLDHALTKVEKANDFYRQKASVLSEWKGQMPGKARDYEKAIDAYLHERHFGKNATKDFAIWTLEDAMSWAKSNN